MDHNPCNNDSKHNTSCPPTVPPTDPPQNQNKYQTKPTTAPPLPTVQVVDQVVDQPRYSGGKGFSPTDPPNHQKRKNKKEIISLHPSFDQNETNCLRVTGITGIWNVKYKIGTTHIHIEYVSPQNQKGRQPQFIEKRERLTYKQFRGQVEAAIWELERRIIGDRQFRVKVWARDKDIHDTEEKWIYGCRLVSVPNPPKTTFIFAAPNGRVIPKFGVDEFELMEEA